MSRYLNGVVIQESFEAIPKTVPAWNRIRRAEAMSLVFPPVMSAKRGK